MDAPRDLLIGAVIGAGVFVIPVYTFAPRAFEYFVEFRRERGPTSGTLWYYFFRDFDMRQRVTEERMVAIVNVVLPLLFAIALVVLLVWTARGRLSPIAACGLATIAFILTNKVYSPQYDLWLVPFLVMLPVRTKLVVHFYVSSALVWILTATEGHLFGRPASLYVLAVGAGYRLVIEALLAREIFNVGSQRAHNITSRADASRNHIAHIDPVSVLEFERHDDPAAGTYDDDNRREARRHHRR